VCSAGTCSLSCQAGLVDCGGKCVDPKADRVFFGAKEDCAAANAGKTCVAGEVCSAGTCTLSCQAELLNCGGKCVDPKADRVFCGARLDCAAANAGKPCAAGEVCSAGICTLTSGHPDASTSTGSRDGSFSADAASSAPDAGVTRDAATAGPDASSSFAFDAGQSGVLCIHAGEMRSPPSSTYGAGQLYVSICPGLTCALSNFAQCTRTLLCSYTPPSCGRCIAGFADGTYTVAAFVDINGDAVSSAPIPSTGDAVPADCGGVTISGGVQAPNPLNIIIQNFAP
jgi:hypothetical protein